MPVSSRSPSIRVMRATATAQLRGDGGVTFCLGNCPYRDAVRENQPAICALHKGITRGLLDVLAPGAKLARFVPHDPDEAGCLIELRGLGDSGE
jgi:predicted ArsR family transcriptional regulator